MPPKHPPRTPHALAFLLSLALFIVTLLLPQPALRAAVNWTGTGGSDWATPSSWNNNLGPSPFDTVNFTDVNSTNIPNDLTSRLSTDRTIGGLTFNNTANHYHTVDLGTHALTINGNLSVNVDQGSNTTATLRNGPLTLAGGFANINVGRSVANNATGILDLSGLTSLTATLQDLNVATSTAGTATGALTLAPTNNITANRIFVAAAFQSNETNGTLRLGLSNTIQATEWTVGKDLGNGVVLITNTGTLTLGSPAQRTNIYVSTLNVATDNNYIGTFDLTGGALNAYVGDFIVGQRGGAGGFGDAIGTFNAGGSGSIDIGAPGNSANFYVGRSITGTSVGTVDFSGLSTLTANLNTMAIGNALSGSARGTVRLAKSNTINAASIIVGAGLGDQSSSLTLGTANTILTNQFIIGQDYANGTVSMPSPGTFSLGSSSQRTSLLIATQLTDSNNAYTGTLDLTGASVSLYLSDLVVGRRGGAGGFGRAIGTFIAGSSGSANIGAPGNTANLTVGQSNTGSAATGTADFSGLTSLTASLNALTVGNANSANTASGTLKLAVTNTISANVITIGAGTADTTASLVLGTANTILANQLIIARDYANAAVTIPSGGSLALGSPSQRTSVSIGVATTNTNNTYAGSLDLTNALLTAYLDNVIVGNKNAQPGNETGSFTISTNPNNHVEINALTLGGNQSTGNFTFGGGALFAGTIARGTGTANFNWTGGQLGVASFGTPGLNFNLNNTGTGILAPAAANGAITTTNIYGTYTQGAAAAATLRIAGTSFLSGNDQINITGAASLAGRLNLVSLNTFTPIAGQNILLANYASRTGTFAFVAPPQLPQNVAFQLEYAPTQLILHLVTPISQNWTSTAAAATFATPANWDTLTAPTTNSTLAIANNTATPRVVTVSASTTVHRISLTSTAAPLTLELPQGVLLGVANQLVLGSNTSLTGAGTLLGDLSVAPLGLVAAQLSATTLTLSGNTTSAGTLQAFNNATLTFAGPATLAGTIQANNGTFNFNNTATILTAPLQLANAFANFNAPAQSAAAITGTGFLTVAPGASLTADSITATSLTLNGNASLRPSATPSKLNTLTLAGAANNWTATLDITNNPLILQPTSNKPTALTTLKNQLAAHALTSTTTQSDPTHKTTVAVDNAVLNLTTFYGQQVDTTSLLVLSTWFGDTNLDRKVNVTDLGTLATFYGQAVPNGILQGDFNQDGLVNVTDLGLLATNYGQGTAPGSTFSLESDLSSFSVLPSVFPTQVPEPASLSLLLPLALLLRRHR